MRKAVAPVNAGTSTSVSSQMKLVVVAAQRSGGPNSSTSRARSRRPRALAQVGEEAGDRALQAGAAGDPLPARLDDPDEAVAVVDRGDRVLRRVGEAVDDQRLAVGLEA